MPTTQEIIIEKQKILEFCELEFATRRPGVSNRYGATESPIMFTLTFDDESFIVVSNIVTHPEWQKRGLFTFLLTGLETGRKIRRVGISDAISDEIQAIIAKRNYRLHDYDYIRTIRDQSQIVALDELPAWLRKVVSWFRRNHREILTP